MNMEAGEDASDLTPEGWEEARREKLRRIVELGHDPWGHRFAGRSMIGEIRQRAPEVKLQLATGQTVELPPVGSPEVPDFRAWLAAQGSGELTGPAVRAAGRIVLSRGQGKLKFIDIRDATGQIQIFIGQGQVGAENWALADCLDLGDLLGVDGQLRRTKTGELTIFAEKLHIMAKSLDPPPAKHKGLTDPEQRQRRRYVDLAYNEGVLERFLKRTKIVQSVRQTLDRLGFCEIEGPTLHAIAGGAAARPFKTHHNALDMELYLRIALELHLKRLLVGGMDRVFELGRVYRNEGISPRHNPEFTMLEVYEAYGDYGTMMDLTEEIIGNALSAIGSPTQVLWGEKEINFARPFARRSYHDLLAEHTGVDPHDAPAMEKYARSIGLDPQQAHPDVVKNLVFEERVEDQLIGPIFVTDYPATICPLTKRNREQPALAERFELFVQGMELANAYTELNDPDLQEELFKTQLAGLAEDDSMARMDHDFIRALRCGMPPAGGLGIGIDRLVMLLTGSASIRDIILFPLLRHET